MSLNVRAYPTKKVKLSRRTILALTDFRSVQLFPTFQRSKRKFRYDTFSNYDLPRQKFIITLRKANASTTTTGNYPPIQIRFVFAIIVITFIGLGSNRHRWRLDVIPVISTRNITNIRRNSEIFWRAVAIIMSGRNLRLDDWNYPKNERLRESRLWTKNRPTAVNSFRRRYTRCTISRLSINNGNKNASGFAEPDFVTIVGTSRDRPWAQRTRYGHSERVVSIYP